MARLTVFLLLAVALVAVQAIDISVKFTVKNCNGQPVAGAKVVMKGCVDYPISNITNAHGQCELGRPVQAHDIPLNFCYHNARHLCQWEVQGSSAVYLPSQLTLMDGYFPITPFEFSGCKCDGTDTCADHLAYPVEGSILFKPSTCPPTTCNRSLFEDLVEPVKGSHEKHHDKHDL